MQVGSECPGRVKKRQPETHGGGTSSSESAYDSKKVRHDLGIGDFVLRLNIRRYQKKEPGAKLLPRWEGPFQVVEVYSNGTAVLCDPSTNKLMPLANLMYLNKYFF